jgi:hypothetical protein
MSFVEEISHWFPNAPQLLILNFPVPKPGGVQVWIAVGQETDVVASEVCITPIGPYPTCALGIFTENEVPVT